jgi:hypothetical protein
VNDVTLTGNCVILFIAGNLTFVKLDLVAILKFNGMPILTIVIVILVVGVILWLINSYIPMQRTIKGILNAVVVIVLVIWLLKVFGVLDSLQNVTI